MKPITDIEFSQIIDILRKQTSIFNGVNVELGLFNNIIVDGVPYSSQEFIFMVLIPYFVQRDAETTISMLLDYYTGGFIDTNEKTGIYSFLVDLLYIVYE